MKKILCLALLSLALGFVHKIYPVFFINTSASLPKGLYMRLWDKDIDKDDLVLICLDENHATFAKSRGYIDKGQCPSHSAPLGKRVQARAFDKVWLNTEGVYVNGNLVKNSHALSHDSHGRKLYTYFENGVLLEDEYIVINSKPESFDSRYFGRIQKEQILYNLNSRHPSFQ